MPKLIGHEPSELDAHESPRETDVQVSYAQARVLRRASVVIRAVLDTSDRGSRGRLAKRWYAWYADPRDILTCPVATMAMRRRARRDTRPRLDYGQDEADGAACRAMAAALAAGRRDS